MTLADRLPALSDRLLYNDVPALQPVLPEVLWRYRGPKEGFTPGTCVQALDIVNLALEEASHPWRGVPGIGSAIAAALYQIVDRQGANVFHVYVLVVATRADAEVIAWWRAKMWREQVHD